MGRRSRTAFFADVADARAAELDAGLAGAHRGACLTTPLGRARALLEGGWVDEPIAVGYQRAGHCGWATGAGTVPQALAPLGGAALAPLAQRGIGTVPRVGHGVEAVSLDDVTHRLGPAEDPGLLRLLQAVLQGGEGVIREVELKGPHRGGRQEKLRQKLPDSPRLLLAEQNLFDSNFSGAAYPVNESDLAHIWPSRYEHINVYGRYHFNIEEARRRQGLRPLRLSGVTMP